jgi:tRNA/rRNA methyltransferase
MSQSLSRCRVVLVRTQFPGNLGAVARIMRNMGLADLALVDPQADRFDPQARQMATHGENILDSARIVDSLAAALGDCVLAAATSARHGGPYRRQQVLLPEEAMPRLLEASGPVALIFGPEACGLTDEEIRLCHYLITIPSAEDYPVLNLAQAVAICLYELRRTWLRQGAHPVLPHEPAAPLEEQERAFAALREAFAEIGYLFGEKADMLMHGWRHLLGRAGPTSTELRWLFGLARQIRWWARHGHAGKRRTGMDQRKDE